MDYFTPEDFSEANIVENPANLPYNWEHQAKFYEPEHLELIIGRETGSTISTGYDEVGDGSDTD